MNPAILEAIQFVSGAQHLLLTAQTDDTPSPVDQLIREMATIVEQYGYERLILGLAAGIAVQIVLLLIFRMMFRLLSLSLRTLTFVVGLFVAIYVLNAGNPTLVDQGDAARWRDEGVARIHAFLEEHDVA